MRDNKKVARMIILGLKKKPDAPDEEAEGSDEPGDSPDEEKGEESDLATAGKEVMDSLKMNDVEGFCESLKSFIKLCGYGE